MDDPAEHSRSMPRAPESAAVARRLVRAVLDAWELSCLADSAELVVSELVANAAEHARPAAHRLHGATIRVGLTRVRTDRVRVTVTDLDRRVPKVRPAGDDQEHGRGLALVEAISEAWGVTPVRWGKHVWAELEA